jgi:hypothetical protein
MPARPLSGKTKLFARVVLLLPVLAGCAAPFGLGTPTTRALESGATASLAAAPSLELAGSYVDAGRPWTLDLQLVRPDSEHVVATSGDQKLEAVLIGGTAYFHGPDFLAAHLGGNPNAAALLAAVGNAWWKGAAASVPRLPDLLGGDAFSAAFLGPAVTQRTDGVSVDGVDAIELGGPRADVFVAAAPPYRVLRVHLLKGVTVDGLTGADLRYQNYGQDFGIRPPSDLLDFSNLSSLPPLYTVLSVDVSGCGAPCLVSANVKNLGGAQPAKAPSSVIFKLTDNATGALLGGCTALISPDVGYNGTTTTGCTISGVNATRVAGATVTATPDNPGRA